MDTKMTKKLFDIYESLVEMGEKGIANEIKDIIVDIIASDPIKEYIRHPCPTPYGNNPWTDIIWYSVVENNGGFNIVSCINKIQKEYDG